MGRIGTRRVWIGAASFAAHALALLWFAAAIRPSPSAPELDPIIEAQIVRFAPRLTPTPANLAPAPARPRLARRSDDDQPLAAPAPLYVPAAPPAATAAPPPPVGQMLSGLRGRLGCTGAALGAMTREERERCEERLAAGVKDLPHMPPGATMGAAKRAGFDRAAAVADARVRAKERPLGAAYQPYQGFDYDDEDPHSPTVNPHSSKGPSKRAAGRLQQLPP